MGKSMNKVNVIKTVLQNMTSKNVGRLPSKSLKSRLVTEANCLAKIHLCEQTTKRADPSSNTGMVTVCMGMAQLSFIDIPKIFKLLF